MKIEMCEQMLQSWLLHIKQCQIVQTNWSISPLHNITTKDIEDGYKFVVETQDSLNVILEKEYLDALQESIDNEEINDNSGKNKKVTKLNIIKKNKASQFMRQCEIDVLGVKVEDGEVNRVFLMDSAFHKGGLGYHDVVATVTKKLIRAIIVSRVIFGDKIDVTVGFASPECKPSPENAIIKVVNLLKTLVVSKYPNVSIELYFNDKFANEIYKPLMDNTDKLNNDNDLFMRALNLIKECDKRMINQTAATLYKNNSSTKISSPLKTPSVTTKSTPTISFIPSDMNVFKNELMTKKRAEIVWKYKDGTVCPHIWKAENIKADSNIRANVQTMQRWKRDKHLLESVTVKIL